MTVTTVRLPGRLIPSEKFDGIEHVIHGRSPAEFTSVLAEHFDLDEQIVTAVASGVCGTMFNDPPAYHVLRVTPDYYAQLVAIVVEGIQHAYGAANGQVWDDEDVLADVFGPFADVRATINETWERLAATSERMGLRAEVSTLTAEGLANYEKRVAS